MAMSSVAKQAALILGMPGVEIQHVRQERDYAKCGERIVVDAFLPDSQVQAQPVPEFYKPISMRADMSASQRRILDEYRSVLESGAAKSMPIRYAGFDIKVSPQAGITTKRQRRKNRKIA